MEEVCWRDIASQATAGEMSQACVVKNLTKIGRRRMAEGTSTADRHGGRGHATAGGMSQVNPRLAGCRRSSRGWWDVAGQAAAGGMLQ